MLEHADVAVIGMGPGGEDVAGWAPVAARIDAEATDNWNDKVAVGRFEGKGGRFIRGEGRLAVPGRVDAGCGSSRPPEPSRWPPAPRSPPRPSPALPTFPAGPIGTRNLAEATV